jgi:hypothetical protein
MSDCISRLRHAIVNHLEIELLKENGLPTPDIQSAKSLKIGDFTYPLTAETLYRHSVDPEAFYTLGAVYFAFVNRTLEHSEYFQKCRQIGVPSVTLIYKRDLFAYLSGESDHSPNIAAGSKGFLNLSINCIQI